MMLRTGNPFLSLDLYATRSEDGCIRRSGQQVATVLRPRRHVRLGRIRDRVAVVIDVAHGRAARLMRPRPVRIHSQPVEVGRRPDVQRHVVARLGQAARQRGACPDQPVGERATPDVVARVGHARACRAAADASAAPWLRERVRQDVGRVVVTAKTGRRRASIESVRGALVAGGTGAYQLLWARIVTKQPPSSVEGS